MILTETKISRKKAEKILACKSGLANLEKAGFGEEATLQEIWTWFTSENSYSANSVMAWLIITLLDPSSINSLTLAVIGKLGISSKVAEASQAVPAEDPIKKHSELKRLARNALRDGRHGLFCRTMVVSEIYRANLQYWVYLGKFGHDFAYYKVADRLLRCSIMYAWRLGKVAGNENFWQKFKQELRYRFAEGLAVGKEFGRRGLYFEEE